MSCAPAMDLSTCASVAAWAAVIVVSTSAIPAQALRGGDLLVSDPGNGQLVSIAPNGTVTPLPTGGWITDPRGLAADHDGSILICDRASDSLLRLDRTGLINRVTNGLLRPERVAVDRDGSYLVVNGSSADITRVYRDGSRASFVDAGSGGMQRPADILVDPAGGYLIADDLGATLFAVSARGSLTPIHSGAPLQSPRGLAQFPDGDFAVIDAGAGSLFRVDHLTHQISVWVPPLGFGGTLAGISETHDGGFYVAEAGAQVQVDRVEPWLSIAVLTAPQAIGSTDDVIAVPTLTGPGSFATGPGSAVALGLDLPNDPNTLYSVALAGSRFPGLGLPNGDPRAMTLTVDGLLLATFASNAPPFLVGFTGVTDAAGRAAPGIDLSLLPPGLLAGTTLHAQGLAFRLGAPNGIAALTNPFALPFR